MVPTEIRCQATRADGACCISLARILGSEPVYEGRLTWESGGRFVRVLVETRYTIDCPRCGVRVKVVKHGR